MSCGPSAMIGNTRAMEGSLGKRGGLFSPPKPTVVERKRLYPCEAILCQKGSLVLGIQVAAKVLFSDIHFLI